MPSEVPISYIELRVFAHATEDLEKVLTAVHNVLPEESREEVEFERSDLTGYYNNPITLLETRIEGKKFLKAAFEKLACNLSTEDKRRLQRDIEQYTEKRNLYIRLDKQSAYLNELKLTKTDPIHIRIRFQIYFKKNIFEEVLKICREFGMFP